MLSHYVPRFILKNFCNANNRLLYCDVNYKHCDHRGVHNAFAETLYYPAWLEESLNAGIESAFSAVLNQIQLPNYSEKPFPDEIVLTRKQLFTIKKFLIITAIRFKYTDSNKYEKITNVLGKDYTEAFISNINKVLRCNSFHALTQTIQELDKQITPIMLRRGVSDPTFNDIFAPDVNLLSELTHAMGTYLCFVRATGSEQFLIPENGRGLYHEGFGADKMRVLLDAVEKDKDETLTKISDSCTPIDYAVYPVSKRTAILAVSPFYKLWTPQSYDKPSGVDGLTNYELLQRKLRLSNPAIVLPPTVDYSTAIGTEYTGAVYYYQTHSLTNSDVAHLNNVMLSETGNLFACTDVTAIAETLKTTHEYTDRDITFLKERLEVLKEK